MSKPKQKETHSNECWDRVDELLAPYNTQLARKFRVGAMNSSQLAFMVTLSVETELIEKKRNKEKASSIVPSYCPFCGKEL
jgi:hypothetical protein